MAATVTLHVWTGADANTDGGSAASFSFGSADAATDTLAWRISNPITIPSSNCAYSYEKWISACIHTAPTNNVNTFEIWGTFPAQTAPTGSTVATSSLGDATSDSKYTWDSASYAAAACQTAYVVNQLQVTSSACVGNWGACDLSYSYSEV